MRRTNSLEDEARDLKRVLPSTASRERGARSPLQPNTLENRKYRRKIFLLHHSFFGNKTQLEPALVNGIKTPENTRPLHTNPQSHQPTFIPGHTAPHAHKTNYFKVQHIIISESYQYEIAGLLCPVFLLAVSPRGKTRRRACAAPCVLRVHTSTLPE